MESALAIEVEGVPISAIATRPDDALATIVVAHGAGSGLEHPSVAGFTRAMHALGFATMRFNFPYREQGRRMPGRPASAVAAWRAVMTRAAELAAAAGASGEPIWAAGRSYGGRMASMAVAEGMDASGLLFLAYPLHAPGRPERPRDEHLYGLTLPMLFVQGTNDPFATPNAQLDEVVARIGPNAVLEWLEGAGHSFEVKGRKRPADEIAAGLAPLVAAFVRARSG
ncbi:dienelactone hydrolase [Agromyces sp. CFH 90414]|uniref:Dienelactone hydrolase n=1 Tax=Agromyces agglutinans TaxID=2662258 RepID=A0A6I2F4Z9_9MICO|nr:alpha/beta family hydrolase [Agromyces agglutinans]MRG59434.1 dienelactone hydrolase [Agromyces agglutinans]